MVVPLIIWGALGVGALVAGGWAADEVGDAAESSTKLVKWAVIGGGLYVSYKALKSAGAIK